MMKFIWSHMREWHAKYTHLPRGPMNLVYLENYWQNKCQSQCKLNLSHIFYSSPGDKYMHLFTNHDHYRTDSAYSTHSLKLKNLHLIYSFTDVKNMAV